MCSGKQSICDINESFCLHFAEGERKVTLFIDKSKKNSRAHAAAMRDMGMLAYGCSIREAFSEIGAKYRAIVLTSPLAISDPCDYADRLRALSGIPVFAMYSDKDNVPLSGETEYIYKKAFDKVLNYSSPDANFVYEMALYCKSIGKQIPGDYRLAGICAVADMPSVRYFNDEVRLSKTEKLVLRYFIRTYPTISSSIDVSKYVFDFKDDGFSSRVRTHISSINRRVKSACGRKCIENVRGRGYAIITPILKEYLEQTKDRSGK